MSIYKFSENFFNGTKRTDRFVWFLLKVLLRGLFAKRFRALVVLLNTHQLLPPGSYSKGKIKPGHGVKAVRAALKRSIAAKR